MTSTTSAAQPTTHGHSGGCCSGFSNWHGLLTTETADGEHALRIDGDRLILGVQDRATVFTLAVAGPGAVNLAVAKDKWVVIADGVLAVADTTPAAFLLDEAESGGMALRTEDGLYIVVSNAGSVVLLTRDADKATPFKLEARQRFSPHWAADEGHPKDESHSSHLWIFNRAIERICGEDTLGTGPKFARSYREVDRRTLRAVLRNRTFTDAIVQGLYDADNRGYCDKDTSGFVFSAHFWHPHADRGGWWDPNTSINAFQYGLRNLHDAIMASDWANCGMSLGLAIHYLEDVTQPMHTGLYPNVPSGIGTILALASRNAPEPLPNLFETPPPPAIPIFMENSRHEYYEQWALHTQARWKINSVDLDALDHPVLHGDHSDYWRWAAEASLKVYHAWIDDSHSPIGRTTPGRGGQWPPHADDLWTTDAGALFRLAQRLVINLLLSWASDAKLAEGYRWLPIEVDQDCVMLSGELTVMTARSGEDQGKAYLSDPGFEESRFWVFEPVIVNGKPLRDGTAPDSPVVCRIRNRQTAKCLIAGDNYDGHVYVQNPDDRTNAQWALIPGNPIIREKYGKSFPSYTIRDLRHRRYLTPSKPGSGGIGPLAHLDDPFSWMVIPRSQFEL